MGAQGPAADDKVCAQPCCRPGPPMAKRAAGAGSHLGPQRLPLCLREEQGKTEPCLPWWPQPAPQGLGYGQGELTNGQRVGVASGQGTGCARILLPSYSGEGETEDTEWASGAPRDGNWDSGSVAEFQAVFRAPPADSWKSSTHTPGAAPPDPGVNSAHSCGQGRWSSENTAEGSWSEGLSYPKGPEGKSMGPRPRLSLSCSFGVL